MSISSQLFFDPGDEDIHASAHSIAQAVRGRYADDGASVDVIAPIATAGGSISIGGPIKKNYPIKAVRPNDPTDREIFDEYPAMWSMYTNPKSDEATVREAAREIFDRLVSSGVTWPLVLAYEFNELVATYDQRRGVRTFPPGTRSDGTDERLWR